MPYYAYYSGDKIEADTEQRYASYHVRRGYRERCMTLKFLTTESLLRCGNFMDIVGDMENVCT